MASLWKHPESKYWFACYTDADGKQRKRSTKETRRREALEIANQYEDAYRKRRTSAQVRKVLLDIHQKLTGEEIGVPTVRAFSESWLEAKKGESAPASHAFYGTVCRSFLEHLGPKAGRPIIEIDASDVRAFWLAVRANRHQNTASHYVKCVRMLFKEAMRQKLILENPAADVATGRGRSQGSKESNRRPFTLPELERVLSIADDEWRSLIRFGYYSGQRIGDLARLTWENIDLERNELRLTTGKTGRVIFQPLAPGLRRHVDSLPTSDDPAAPLHPRAYAKAAAKTSTSTLSNQFADLLCQAGLRPRVNHDSTGKGRDAARDRQGLSFHSLRHTARTLLQDAGVSLKVAQEFIGHSDMGTSLRYAHVSREAMEQAANSLPELK